MYQHIDLSHNLLSRVSPDVRYLVCVRELNLDGNRLEQLPLEMARLKLLCVLSLKDNSILCGSYCSVMTPLHLELGNRLWGEFIINPLTGGVGRVNPYWCCGES